MFRRIITSWILGFVGLLIVGPTFASTGVGIDNSVILSSYDICKVSMQCEESQDGLYTCSTDSELLSMTDGDIHHIPVSKSYDALAIVSEPRYYTFDADICTEDTFSDISIPSRPYPFVRIIKIQV